MVNKTLLESMTLTFKSNSLFKRLKTFGQINSLWPFPMVSGCCSIELANVYGPKFDIGRQGLENIKVSPRQADLLIISGTVNSKRARVIQKIYSQMSSPKWVLAIGACAASGGLYRSYQLVGELEKVIPVDVVVPGCPPSPDAIVEGLMEVRKKILWRT